MSIRIQLLFLCFLSLLNIASARAASATLPATFDIPAIDAYLASEVRNASRVGWSVAIVKDGRMVLSKNYGFRSLADRRPVDDNTLFAIGSVTKQFACACILLLAEDGKLSPHDPVSKYYPNLTRARDISLLDLMNHVSGYPDYYPLDFVDRRMQRPIAEDELLRQYAGGKLDFEPRSKYSYSNTGYILLGRVVEQVSGESFGTFLTRRILKPLGMTKTAYEPDPNDPRLARGYTTFALGAPEPIQPEGKGWIAAAGGIYSTPSDLAKWNLALMDARILKPASYALMTNPRQLSNGKISEYGCGLSVKVQQSREVLAHNGAVAGFNATSAMIPSTRSMVIMMCNVDGGLGPVPGQLLSLLLKEPATIPEVRGASVSNTVTSLFLELQKGDINRRRYAEEFNLFLTAERVAGAAERLKPLGLPTHVEVLSTHERGGMEVTTCRLRFRGRELRTLMYRRPDGIVEQFFVSED